MIKIAILFALYIVLFLAYDNKKIIQEMRSEWNE